MSSQKQTPGHYSHTTFDDFDFTVTRLEWLPSKIAHLILDNSRSSANVMSAALQSELEARILQLRSVSQCRGLIVSSAKENIFIAGADIKFIAATADFTRNEVVAFCERGLRLYQSFCDLPFPTIALIRGACLGGGFEFALALDWRIAADSPTTVLGLPEVHLGLVPGWAATARVPRLSSVETAMRLIGSGIQFPVTDAVQFGLIDQAVPPEQLLEAAIEKLSGPPEWIQQRRQELLLPAARLRMSSETIPTGLDADNEGEAAPLADGDLFALAETVLGEVWDANPSLHPVAPGIVVDLIARSATVDFFAACTMESQAMAEVYTSATGQALVHAFLLNDRAKKSPGLGPCPDPVAPLQCVGLIGLGLMGQSIANLARQTDWKFVLYDQDPIVRQEVARQLPNEQFAVVDHLAAFEKCDAVLENVYEHPDIKQSVLQSLEKVVRPDALLFSNTSVIPISDLASALERPERFCGLHFFNPIRETKLAEIAVHPKTGLQAPWAAAQIAKQLRKQVIVVGDGPGLVVNRLLMAMLNEAQRMLAEGFSVSDIDQAAAEFGWRLGPFRILDVIGIKTALQAGTQIARHLPDAVSAPPFLVLLSKAGRLGRQAGAGFYRYSTAGEASLDADVSELLSVYIRRERNSTDTFRSKNHIRELAHRLVAAMVVQAVHILQRGQVRDAAEIDLCCLLALGFPPSKGGVLYWVDHYPIGRFIEELSDRALSQTLAKAMGAVTRFYTSKPGFENVKK